MLEDRSTRTSNSSFRARICLLSLILAGSACSIRQRAAEKLLDPQLLAEGDALEREQGGRDLQLGPYRVVGLEQSEAPRAESEGGQGRPTLEYQLRFTLEHTQAPRAQLPWRADCTGVRRQPIDHDFAAAADEARDEVALRCVFAQGEAQGDQAERWELELAGTLANNLFGELVSTRAAAGDPSANKRVEVLMWHRVWKISRRPLPASLATVLGAEGSEAALILSGRERAWLAPTLAEQQRGLAMATLLALRLIPLGFEL